MVRLDFAQFEEQTTKAGMQAVENKPPAISWTLTFFEIPHVPQMFLQPAIGQRRCYGAVLLRWESTFRMIRSTH